MCRELQMIEERYSERLRSTNEMSEESHLFLGTHSSRGNVCMDPALREWIATELKDEAAISKERRKACEERHLQHAPPHKADKGRGKGGEKEK